MILESLKDLITLVALTEITVNLGIISLSFTKDPSF